MTYQLAKQLKDAGFQQQLWPGSEYYQEGLSKTAFYCENFMEGEQVKDKIKTPSLHELIEACGEKFGTLFKHYGQIGATSHVTPWWSAQDRSMQEDEVGPTGITPEEAVANLWLKLNGNSRTA